MKIKGAKQVHYDAGPNMTPLVDVVMVILIFLMMTGSFITAEHFLTSNMPITAGGTGGVKAPAGWIPDEPLEIRVDSPAPDEFVARAGRIQVGDARSLESQLRLMREQLNAAGTETDRIQVKINPGRDVRYKHLVAVYEAALNAEFTKVAFTSAH